VFCANLQNQKLPSLVEDFLQLTISRWRFSKPIRIENFGENLHLEIVNWRKKSFWLPLLYSEGGYNWLPISIMAINCNCNWNWGLANNCNNWLFCFLIKNNCNNWVYIRTIIVVFIQLSDWIPVVWCVWCVRRHVWWHRHRHGIHHVLTVRHFLHRTFWNCVRMYSITSWVSKLQNNKEKIH